MIDTVQQTAVVEATRDAVSRAVRQALQTLVPTLLVVAGGTATGIDVPAVVALAAVTALVSLLKSVTGFKLPADAPVAWQVAERAVTAAAGAALGFLTVGGTDIASSIPWEATLTGALGAAGVAAVMFFTNPPVVEGDVLDVRDELVSPPTTSIRVQHDLADTLPRRERRTEDGGQ